LIGHLLDVISPQPLLQILGTILVWELSNLRDRREERRQEGWNMGRGKG
jgi:hypothetical protein